jgi:superfamily II DNA or RNA helicase
MSETKVVLSNRKALFVRPYPYDELNELLKFRRPGWEYTNSGKIYLQWQENVKKGKAKPDEPQGWDGYLHLLQRDMVGAGVFLALRETLETGAQTRFAVRDNRRPPDLAPDMDLVFNTPDTRTYQYECVKAMLANSKTGGLILNATGTGKTFIAGKYLKMLQGPALFLVDELTLLDQAQKELTKVIGEPVGNIGNQKFNPQRVTVATIQTIHRHRFDAGFVPWNRTLKCIIIDELHLSLNRSNFQTIAAIQPPVVFGLTATLELKKKNVAYRAYDLCGPAVFEYPLTKGVEEGFLAKGIAVSVEVGQKSSLPAIRGNPRWRWVREAYKKRYHESYSELIVDGKDRNKTIISLVRAAYKKGKHIIVLLERVQHLKNLGNRLDGVPHNLVFGEVRAEDRIDAKHRFDKGKLRVILTNKVFKKGIDIKKVDVIIDGAAMKSRNDAVQKYGRGVRLCDGKDGLIYFDIADVGNSFEKAAVSRRTALKKIGVPVYKIDAERGAAEILDLAESKLQKLLDK